MRIIVSGGNDTIFKYPKQLPLCYECYGNSLSALGHEVYFIGKQLLNKSPLTLRDFDVLMLEIPGADEHDNILYKLPDNIKVIGVQHGPNYMFDRTELCNRANYLHSLEQCDIIITSAYNADKWYKLYVDIPVLNDFPPPIPVDYIESKIAYKNKDARYVLHGILPGGGDRPFVEAGIMANRTRNNLAFAKNAQKWQEYFSGLSVEIHRPVSQFKLMSEYMPEAEAFVMVGEAHTMGRMCALCAIVRIPCIASAYFYQTKLFPELVVTLDDISTLNIDIDTSITDEAHKRLERYNITSTATRLKRRIEWI